ncbi:MAG: GNAT family N-acetyltransferase [Sediminimonas qiaohouensis]|uniref:GNAT family N-acetyltransferase n=1 Tax=Sediminimonas qiaohouensis TaxID=552061 RepID=A0A7C9HL24_9RHOB|nr:GNAT family N-acetyltransferase [Sediminimonas qiaohouensis]MTJ04228.1 GNAT family N-acetyltransferase [Sediminimonas qiaohouensis]
MLEPGLHAVPKGHTAAIVTHLEMLHEAPQRPEADLPLHLTRVPQPGPEWYLDLFRRIGAPWLWFGRLEIPREALLALLADPGIHVHVLMKDDAEIGLLELDFRHEGACELAYFGLIPGAEGGGAGRWMMNRAIALAWGQGISRLHVHTCTLDHPAALDFYRRSGFTAYRREIEIARDPRLAGLLPRDAAPQVPLIE